MSTIFERARLIGAVVICTGLFVFSTWTMHGNWEAFQFGPTPAKDLADVHAGLAILEKAKAPMVDIDPCDGVTAFLPNKFSPADNSIFLNKRDKRDVILCFKNDIDYGQALKASETRKLFWQRGIGGDKFLVFAPSEERFMTVAKENGLTFGPDDLKEISLYMGLLRPHDRAHKDSLGWLISPAGLIDSEALFGPYIDLEPGLYTLQVAFQPVGAQTCGYVSRELRVQLAATASARRVALAPKQGVVLRSTGARCRLEGQITFTVPAGGAKSVETPIWVLGQAPVKLVGYDIFKRS